MFPLLKIPIVAPYWDHMSFVVKGSMRFGIIDFMHSQSVLIQTTNEVIREKDFNASWLLVVRWIDVCPVNDVNCTKVNKNALHNCLLL